MDKCVGCGLPLEDSRHIGGAGELFCNQHCEEDFLHAVEVETRSIDLGDYLPPVVVKQVNGFVDH